MQTEKINAYNRVSVEVEVTRHMKKAGFKTAATMDMRHMSNETLREALVAWVRFNNPKNGVPRE